MGTPSARHSTTILHHTGVSLIVLFETKNKIYGCSRCDVSLRASDFRSINIVPHSNYILLLEHGRGRLERCKSGKTKPYFRAFFEKLHISLSS